MVRQTRAKKTEQLVKGKVTPVQIAYIVDQYLSENHFTETRTSFRFEASALISQTPLHEGTKGLMSLGMIIDEYVRMKEEKVVVEMEGRRIEEERFRVQSLLCSMQNVMNDYNGSSVNVSAVAASVSAFPAAAQQSDVNNVSHAGSSQQSAQQPTTLQSSTSACVDNVSPVQESSVAIVIFHQTTSTSAMQNSSGPVTPPRASSANSEKNDSPVGNSSSTNSSNKNTSPDFASNCTIVSTKTVIVSPYKQATYYSVEKHWSSRCSPAKSDLQRSIKRDRVKSRLNFGGADEKTALDKTTSNQISTSETDDGNCFDLDLPVLDFDIAELLMDFDIYFEDPDVSLRQVIVSSPAKCPSTIDET